jgi:glycerol-3-phosphate acyltransferase PlsX
MTQGGKPRIAIDAMGGDVGPAVMVAGAVMAQTQLPGVDFLLFGDEAAIRAELSAHQADMARFNVIHCPEVISGSDKPTQAIRRAKTTSMGQMIDAVKTGKAQAALSGGNTGALMAMSKLSLRMLPSIDRPAIAALLPTLGTNDMVMLDLGANTECNARNLFQFALMGAAYARSFLDIERPRVALLNIGTEELKGTDELKEAAALLREAKYLDMEFQGYIEGDKISRGEADVVVTDGFSGNIALKTAEGTARFVTDLLKRAFTSSLRSKLGFLISRPAAELLRHHLDPNNHNGGVLLGLNGLVVKSHGGANARGVANAIRVAAKLIDHQLTRKITEDLESFRAHHKGEEIAG